MLFSRGSSPPRDRNCLLHLLHGNADEFFTTSATWEARTVVTVLAYLSVLKLLFRCLQWHHSHFVSFYVWLFLSPWLVPFSLHSLFKVFIKFITILFLLCVLVFCLPWGMWDLSFLIRDQIGTPCIGRQGLNHQTTRDVPDTVFLSWQTRSHMIISRDTKNQQFDTF